MDTYAAITFYVSPAREVYSILYGTYNKVAKYTLCDIESLSRNGPGTCSLRLLSQEKSDLIIIFIFALFNCVFYFAYAECLTGIRLVGCK